MKLGTGNRKQTMLAGVLGVLALVACIFIYEEMFGGSSTPSPAPAPAAENAPAPVAPPTRTQSAATSEPAAAAPIVGARSAKAVGTTSSALDPTLHMEAMLVSESLEYAGSGRNIFSPNSTPPVVIPKPIALARNQPAVQAPPPQPVGPPPPPPIDLKFFGFETSANGNRQAFLLHNDNVYLASTGDIVMRRYRVVAINARTIQVTDMQNNNTQTLPLLAN
jgi:hypothetical protein